MPAERPWSDVVLPPLHLVRQEFPAPSLADPAAAVAAALRQPAIAAAIRPGMRVAIAVGSRGIAGLAGLVRASAEALRALGATPFIVPAMGSHGGATADGQRALLTGFGVDETIAPVRSAMGVRTVGWLRWDETRGDYAPATATDAGAIPVHVDRIALDEADAIVPLVRVKPHTGFRGRYESGICKMLAVGLGKHAGAAALHAEGYARFARLIPAAAAAVLATGRIACALAVVENAAERPALIEAVPAAAILAREPELLDHARALMPRILLPEVDVLVVERIGKDISGVGMDANVIGRSESGRPIGFAGPDPRRIVVLGLTPASAGNATGIGMADLISSACRAAIDEARTAINVLTSGSLAGGRIPVAVPGSDDDAVRAALRCVPGRRPEDVLVVRIRDTLRLGHIAVSANLLPTVATLPGCRDLGAFTGWPAEPGAAQ